MNRREFLISGFALAVLANLPILRAQGSGSRAAIVIGVNRSAGFQALQGSVPGARKVSSWLRAEGFDVKTLDDKDGPLRLNDVYSVAKGLIDLGTLDQLVIFFSGHGVNLHSDECWLLSEAPGNPNEVISVRNSVYNARWTGIPSVVFISDACRTPPNDFNSGQLRQGTMIPPLKPSSTDVEVDRFFATLPGDPALEFSFSKNVNRHSVFTEAFLEAYRNPYVEMVAKVNGVEVIPNRSLKQYLTTEVPKRVQLATLERTQYPQSIIESGSLTYIGRASNSVSPRPKASEPEVTITDVANFALKGAGVSMVRAADPTNELERSKIDMVSSSVGFNSAREKILEASRDVGGKRSFETQTGLNIYGSELKEVITKPSDLEAGVFTQNNGRPWIVRLRPVAGSVILRFQDDSGAIVACLPGYVGTVVVKETGVASISYEPSKGGDLEVPAPEIYSKLQELRSAVAVAARFGTLNFQGDNTERNLSARIFGDKIRELKRIDPTLGIYAAYAYADAGLIEQVRSVHTYMRRDLSESLSVNSHLQIKKNDIFDVSMLSGVLPMTLNDYSVNTVPFCPMLSQGWGLLTAYGVTIDPFLEEARRFLRPALWTTFRPEIMDDLKRFIVL